MFASCLVSATHYKKQWRGQQRKTTHVELKSKQEDKKSGEISEDEDEGVNLQGSVEYLSELTVCKQWKQLMGKYKGDIGCLGIFESMSEQKRGQDEELSRV